MISDTVLVSASVGKKDVISIFAPDSVVAFPVKFAVQSATKSYKLKSLGKLRVVSFACLLVSKLEKESYEFSRGSFAGITNTFERF